MTIDEIQSLTRRELSELIDAMVSRKQGYEKAEENVNIETSEEIKAKVAARQKKRFLNKEG